MASELKPWRYEIKYGPEGEDAYSWVYDDHGAMVATMKTHKAKQIVDAMNTRPAPAATDTGLVTVEYQVRSKLNGHWVKDNFLSQQLSPDTERRELVTRSQAEAIIAAERAEKEGLIHDLNRIKDHETELVNDNAAQAARIKELEEYFVKCTSNETFLEQDARRVRQIEALEAKLAAAEKALEAARPYVEDYDTRRHNTGVDETLTQIDAVLGGKPS